MIVAQIRLANEADLIRVNEIYNHYVIHSTCTYQEAVDSTDDRRRWFAIHGARHPVTVATLDEQIVGWGSLSPYHVRSAYERTVENSVYVHQDFHRRGIGSLILKDLIGRATVIGHHVIIAAIDFEQPASIALHRKFGFTEVGHFKEVGNKFQRWLDVVYMQLLLRDRHEGTEARRHEG